MAKIMLRKYQRDLVPYFKKFQLTEIEGDQDMDLFDVNRVSSQVGDLTEGLMGRDEEYERLKTKRIDLKDTIQKRFD